MLTTSLSSTFSSLLPSNASEIATRLHTPDTSSTIFNLVEGLVLAGLAVIVIAVL